MFDISSTPIGRIAVAIILTEKYSPDPGVSSAVVRGRARFSRGWDNGRHPSKSARRTGDGVCNENRQINLSVYSDFR